jgi:cell division septation protein DedD
VNILKETPDVKLQINSHSDERGEANYNKELSQRRAQSVVDYLIAKGINSERLIAKGYGFEMPIIKHAKTEEEHQKNRRTTFKILNSSEIKKSSSTSNYVPSLDEQTTANTTPTTTGSVSTTSSAPVTTTNQVTTSQPNTLANATTPATSFAHKFFIIAGSYPSEKAANDAISLLKTTGYPNAEMVGLSPSGSWRIAYSGFVTKDEAMAELTKIKQTISSAWVYEKK